MKIIAEFNSTSEVLEFINTFGAKAAIQLHGENVGVPVKVEKVGQATKDKVAEQAGQDNEVTSNKEEKVKGVKVTKEQVRAAFTKLIKAGKQKEAKELTLRYGASKVSEVKEEDYAAILKDVEGLL